MMNTLTWLWFSFSLAINFSSAAPGEVSREELIKRSDLIVVASRLEPFRKIHSCGYPSEWKFKIEEILFTKEPNHSEARAEALIVSDAAYEMLLADCKRKQKSGGEPPELERYRPLDTSINLEHEALPEKVILFLVHRKRPMFKDRIELVVGEAMEHDKERTAVVKQISVVKK